MTTPHPTPAGDCTCPPGPEDAHFPDCPMWQAPAAAPPVDVQPASDEALTSTDHNMAPQFTPSAGDPQSTDDEPAKTVRDADGNYLGQQPRPCGEHRTVGDYRAWCYDDREWCYPAAPCRGCETGEADRELALTRAELAAERAAHQATRDELRNGISIGRGSLAGEIQDLMLRIGAERDRADKALILAEAAMNSFAQATGCVAPESNRHAGWYADIERYAARLADLRGDTGEGRTDG